MISNSFILVEILSYINNLKYKNILWILYKYFGFFLCFTATYQHNFRAYSFSKTVVLWSMSQKFITVSFMIFHIEFKLFLRKQTCLHFLIYICRSNRHNGSSFQHQAATRSWTRIVRSGPRCPYINTQIWAQFFLFLLFNKYFHLMYSNLWPTKFYTLFYSSSYIQILCDKKLGLQINIL